VRQLGSVSAEGTQRAKCPRNALVEARPVARMVPVQERLLVPAHAQVASTPGRGSPALLPRLIFSGAAACANAASTRCCSQVWW